MASRAQLFLDILARVKGDRSVDKLADSLEDAGDAAVKANRDASASSKGFESLTKVMDDTTARVKALKEEFNRTGDMSLLKEINKGERTLANTSKWLERTDNSAGKSVGSLGKLGEAFGKLGTAGTPLMASGGVVAALGAVPAIAAAAGFALAGLGAGFIGLGAMALKNSAQVKGALTLLGNTASGVGSRAASVLERPFVRALSTIRSTVLDLEPALKRMFTSVAPSVETLANGIRGLANNAMPGLERAVGKSGGILDTIAAKMPETGKAIGSFFDSLAGSAEGGGRAVALVFNSINYAIVALGKTIETGSKLFAFLTEGWGASLGGVMPLLAQTGDEAKKIGPAAKEGAAGGEILEESLEGVAGAAKEAAFWTKSFTEASGLLKSGAIATAQAEMAAADAMTDLAEAVKESKGSFDRMTPSGRAAEAALLRAATAAGVVADRTFDETNSVDKANAAFQRQIGAMRGVLQAAGVAPARIDALSRSFLASRGPANSSAASIGAINNQIRLLKDKQVTAKARGDSGEVRRLQAEIDRLHGKTVYLTTVRSTVYQQGKLQTGPRRDAAGGPVTGPGTGTSDSIPAMLSDGEFVVRAKSAGRAGLKGLDYLNRTGHWPTTPVPVGVGGGGGGGPYHFHFHGPVGSRTELENWLTRSLDNLRRQGRV